MQLTKILYAALFCNAAGIALACDIPPLVVVPDKEDAVGKEDELRAALAKYFAAMQVYTQCVQAELAAAGGENAPQITRAVLVQRNNLAVAEAEAVFKTFTANVGPVEAPEPSPRPPAAN
jgi:hypothetical protein